MNLKWSESQNCYVYDDGTKLICATQLQTEEFLKMNDKLNQLRNMQAIMNQLYIIENLLTYINDNSYGQAQSDAFTDSDAQELKGNLAADDIFNCVNLLDQIQNLLTNQVPTQADYTAIVNRVRDGT